MRTTLDYLENTAKLYPDRVLYADESRELTFSEVMNTARNIGNMLSRYVEHNQPVAVISQRSALTPVLFMSVTYAGCFYVPINIKQPIERMNKMLSLIDPAVILTDDNCEDTIEKLDFNGQILSLSDAQEYTAHSCNTRKDMIIDTDPLYVLFTSGSTGIPKGIVVSHRSVIDYLNTFIETFSLDEHEIYGAQADFGFDVSLGDIYIPLITAAKTVVISADLFSTPQNLFDYINAHQMTSLCWVTTALSVCCSFNIFEQYTLNTVKKVFLAGSALPAKDLRMWQKSLPGVTFINHYGPTEITVTCTYHVFDHIVKEDEDIPIGIPFQNRDVFLLSEDGTAVETGQKGEICVAGTCLALGYYKDIERTNEVFVNNPLKPFYPQRIYKTGDLGSFRKDGILLYHNRLDRQIKYMGYRIELGEIEVAASRLSGINACACIYNTDEDVLSFHYEGSVDKKAIVTDLRRILPGYMVPRKITKHDKLPMGTTGKIDYKQLH